MALTGVSRPGHVALRVLELEPALKHYRDVQRRKLLSFLAFMRDLYIINMVIF